jgi:tetratricopeptide (TPR) repeat protein
VAISARRTFDLGQAEGASRLYRKALEMARAADNSPEIAANAYNLALCLVALGKYDEAVPYLDEAEAESARRSADTAHIRLLKAKTFYLGGDTQEAASLAQTALKHEGSLTPAARSQFDLLLARIALDGRDLAGAKAGLERAQDALEDEPDTPLQAETAGLSGAILAAEGSFDKAAKDFDRQADFCRKGEKYREMAEALSRAGETYLKGSDNRAAADRFFRAARSFYSQGDTVRALKTIESALAVLDKEADPDAFRNIAALFEEIKKSAPPAAE